MLATLVGIVVIAAACGPRLALAPTAPPASATPVPGVPASLTGPIALHIPRSGPIEFLGHVDLANGAVVGSVSDAAGASATIRNGVVRAVDGWLTSVATSCGPAPIPFDPPLPNPFNCQP